MLHETLEWVERIKALKHQPTNVLHAWLKELDQAPVPRGEFDLDIQNAAMILIRSELTIRIVDQELEERERRMWPQ